MYRFHIRVFAEMLVAVVPLMNWLHVDVQLVLSQEDEASSWNGRRRGETISTRSWNSEEATSASAKIRLRLRYAAQFVELAS